SCPSLSPSNFFLTLGRDLCVLFSAPSVSNKQFHNCVNNDRRAYLWKTSALQTSGKFFALFLTQLLRWINARCVLAELRSFASKNWRTVENDREKLRLKPLEIVCIISRITYPGFCL